MVALTVVVVCIDQMFIAGVTGRPHRESLTADVLFLSSFALPAISIIGVGLGIAGLLYNGRGKTLACLSVAGNAAIIFLVCAFMALAALFAGYGSTP